VKSELVNAPYAAECSMVAECKVIHVIDIGLHTQFIGEIMDIKVEEDVLTENGLPDMEKVAPFIFAPEVRCYYEVGRKLGQVYVYWWHKGTHLMDKEHYCPDKVRYVIVKKR
jgi:flavin reductase (DIM6/NTAB) family NADH-FMN oxidoreductase RutF